MSIYDRIQRKGNSPTLLEQIKSNPAELLKQRGLTIPAGMNNPQQIIQHLIQSGQISNSRLQMALRMMGRR